MHDEKVEKGGQTRKIIAVDCSAMIVAACECIGSKLFTEDGLQQFFLIIAFLKRVLQG